MNDDENEIVEELRELNNFATVMTVFLLAILIILGSILYTLTTGGVSVTLHLV